MIVTKYLKLKAKSNNVSIKVLTKLSTTRKTLIFLKMKGLVRPSSTLRILKRGYNEFKLVNKENPENDPTIEVSESNTAYLATGW